MPDLGRVLVVDDEEPLRRAICRSLKKHGVDSVDVGSGEEALAVLAAESIQAVITDFRMPGTDGVKLTRMILAMFPSVRVIGISSEGMKEEFMRAGAKAFLQKPFERDELLNALQDVPKS